MRPRPLLSLALLALLAAGCTSPGGGPPPAASPCGAPVAYDALRFDTDAGPFTVILYNESAPRTVELMLAYAHEGYYEGRSFGRVVPGHVIQVTDASGGASDDGRRVPLETSAEAQFSAGAVGIARGTDPDSGGPEFFVMDFATSHLHGNYTVWGQVVEGLGAVHRIARAPAVDFRQLPAETAAVAPTDRLAVVPTLIRAVTPTRVTPAAGLYPLQVAQNVRSGDYRHSLEWPRCLVPGQAADLTWYIRPYNGTAPPDAGRVRIEVDGQPAAVQGEAETPGVYHVTWTVAARGTHAVRLLYDGKALATLSLRA